MWPFYMSVLNEGQTLDRVNRDNEMCVDCVTQLKGIEEKRWK